jgi:precorrin-4/cobalt-precorrin-4 C11-methyltransferase
MTVFFIGAGPGAADLVTLRGMNLLARCPVCLHAGSVVAPDMLAHCAPGTRLVDTAPLDLDAIIGLCAEAHERCEDVARLHGGDPAVFSAVGEQMRRLAALGIPTEIVPGVSAMAAAAAALGRELTVPHGAQSVVLTRLSGRASPVPESLEALAATGATLAIHLSVHRLAEIAARLAPVLGPDCPAAVVERASRAEERRWEGTLADIVELVGTDAPPRLAIVLVGRALGEGGGESALYAADYPRRFRS